MKLIWYPFHVADYSRDTGHLSMLEHGAYRLLLDHYYMTGSPLPANAEQLHRICRAIAHAEQQAVQTVVQQFFQLTDAGYTHERVEAELAEARQLSEKRRQAAASRHSKKENKGAAGGAIGGAIEDANAGAIAEQMQVQLQTQSQSQCTSNDVLNPPTPLEGDAPRKAQRRVWNPKAIELPASISPQAWGQWIDYRRSRGLTVNEKTVKAQITKLDEWAALGQAPAAVIERSITNGWQGLFELPANNNATRSMSNGTNGQLSERLRVAGEIFGPAATPAAGGDFIEGASIRLNG